MELRREAFPTELLLPGSDERRHGSVEVRWDPITGHTVRLVSGATLLPTTTVDVATVVADTLAGCPFCPDAIEKQTPRFPPTIIAEGRFRVGAAVLFPNLMDYSQYSSVAVYSAGLHHLPLGEFTVPLLRDGVRAQVAFLTAVRRADPAAAWASVNANHLPPSGSSIYHPHTQGACNPVPTTMQRLLAEVPPELHDDYLSTERRLGERYLACTGTVHWFAAFAPIAPAEIRALIPRVSSPEKLDDDVVVELAEGLCRVLALYADLGVSSFNLACYGTPVDGQPMNVRIAARSGMGTFYRSDSTHLERLHWEAATGIRPEDLAERARPYFS